MFTHLVFCVILTYHLSKHGNIELYFVVKYWCCLIIHYRNNIRLQAIVSCVDALIYSKH